MKLKIWIGFILSTLFKFGTPVGIAYWKFSIHEESVGVGFFYFVSSIVLISFFVKLKNIIKEQSASKTKIVFKYIMNMSFALVLYWTAKYIGTNFTELIFVIFAWVCGYTIGSIIDMFIVDIDRKYIEEIGVI